VKQVQIVVPFEKTEAVYDFLLDVLMVKNIMKFTSDNAHLLTFRIPDDAALETMEKLKSRGVGVEYGFIDILDLKASLPRESEEVREGRMQREATLAVEEIYENVKSHASLSFDFLAFTIFAAAMAGLGLILNNVTIIVASMLLPPLMVCGSRPQPVREGHNQRAYFIRLISCNWSHSCPNPGCGKSKLHDTHRG